LVSPTIDIVSTENDEYRTHLISGLTVWQWQGCILKPLLMFLSI